MGLHNEIRFKTTCRFVCTCTSRCILIGVGTCTGVSASVRVGVGTQCDLDGEEGQGCGWYASCGELLWGGGVF